MSYRVVIPKPVKKQLDQLPQTVFQRMLPRLWGLQEEPRPQGCVKLQGGEDEYRIRIGDYRIRYAIDDAEQTIILLHVLHRKDVYRRL